jgi:hypothetical protein
MAPPMLADSDAAQVMDLERANDAKEIVGADPARRNRIDLGKARMQIRRAVFGGDLA